MNINSKAILIGLLTILALFVLSLSRTLLPGPMPRSKDTSSQAGNIHITSPLENSVVIAGQTLSVTIEPRDGISLQEAWAEFYPSSFDIPQTDNTQPFVVSVSVPDDRLGPAILKAAAIDQDGNPLETSINLVIEPPIPPQGIEVRPEKLFFSQLTQSRNITVNGIFPKGIRRDLSRSPNTSYISTNPKVVTVSPNGRVQAIASGISTINITHGIFSKAIRVSVGVFELRGDLDGDLDVDQDDLNIILAARNTEATGPGDPRDLNNDGRIDALDSRILVTLCLRPQCATR